MLDLSSHIRAESGQSDQLDYFWGGEIVLEGCGCMRVLPLVESLLEI